MLSWPWHGFIATCALLSCNAGMNFRFMERNSFRVFHHAFQFNSFSITFTAGKPFPVYETNMFANTHKLQ